MKTPGNSIAGMMGLVFVTALAFAALKYPLVILTNLASSLVLLLLLTSIAGALLQRGLERAYWTGFAIFGWTTLFFVSGSWIAGQFGSDLTSSFQDLAEMALARQDKSVTVAFAPATPGSPGKSMNFMAEHSIKVGNLVEMARLMMVLLFALTGGFIAQGFVRRAERSARESESSSASRQQT